MYQHILVPVDGSPTSDVGLEEAIKLARVTGGRVRLLHVVGDVPSSMNAQSYGALASDVRIFREGSEKILATAKAKVEQGGIAVDAVLLEGSADRLVEHVADQLKTWGADLIVLGTHGRHGLGRLMLGSRAEEVLRAATVPVLLVHSQQPVTVIPQPDGSLIALAAAQAVDG